MIPHITNEIKARIRSAADESTADVVISEIGGTVGDIESLPFLEAIRQFRREAGPENVLYLHVTLVPFIEAAGELKTKPTQHSVNELRRIGIHPDIVVARSSDELSRDIRDKIALFADVDARGRDRVTATCATSTSCPSVLEEQGLDTLVCEQARPARRARPTSTSGARSSSGSTRLEGEVEIALVGKYVKLHDAYLSVHEALKHAGVHHGVRRARALVRRREHDARGGERASSRGSTACSFPAASARAAGRARSSPAASRASAGSRTSASASACTSRCRSSRVTSSGSTARTRPRWIRRRRTR